MTTEEGLTKLGGLGDLSRSYVISFENNTLQLILGGYFFKISNIDNYADLTDAYFYIKLKEVSIVESESSANQTHILSTLYESTDDKLDAFFNGEDWFTGLAYSSSIPDAGYISLKIFANDTDELTLERSVKLPSYDPSTGAFKVGSENVTSGKRSVATGSATTATGENSFAQGLSTRAIGNNSFSGGNESVADGANSFAFGHKVTANGENSVAFGESTSTHASSQFVIGRYNKQDSDDIFEIGAGNASDAKNAFAVKEDEINNNVSKVTFGDSYIDRNHLHAEQITTTGDVSFCEKTAGDESTHIFEVSSGKIVANTPFTLNADLSMKNGKVSSKEIETNVLSAAGKTTLANSGATFDANEITLDRKTQINEDLTVAKSITAQQTLDVYGSTNLGQSGTIATFAPNAIQLKQPTTIFNNLTVSKDYDLTITDANNKLRRLKEVISDLDALSSGLAESITTKDLSVTDKITAKAIEMTDLDASITLGDSAQNTTEAGSTLLKVYGRVEANRYSARSDARLKENLREYTPKKSILDLPVYEYDYKNGDKNVIGCTAQDLREICPEIVSENSDGYLVIEEYKIVYLLLQEVKKLKEEVETLKKKGN